MYTRIKQLRRHLGLSQEEFGSKLGVTRDVINNIERNRNKTRLISDVLFNHLCSTFNVNSDWLLTGNGEMFNPVDDYTASIQNRSDLSPKAKFLLTRFLSMSTEEQDELVDLLKKLTSE